MAVRLIPEGSVEIQTGLWAAENTFTMNGVQYTFYNLYSAEGYCFWEVNQPENYDKEGGLLPLAQRVFAQYAHTAYRTIEDLNANFVSVPIQEGFKNVSAGANTETA